MTKALVISALNKAYTIQEPREGLIHHSDRGSQYASIEYQNLLREEADSEQYESYRKLLRQGMYSIFS
ncbi:hypothetical protein K9F06_12355 [Staphylococcus pseudintermedius]|nr:hypothetical protein K9F08_12355 [Staphylococcus pseudintermedius]URY21973.1 hypothetical protein K9F06_12355 [Staphylococcus pseudintermedius]